MFGILPTHVGGLPNAVKLAKTCRISGLEDIKECVKVKENG
jgi:hypothetical protein